MGIKDGAIGLFHEKYGDQKSVRVVVINKDIKEICCGTHIQSTGKIGMFKTISESSVSSGVRRFEAITGEYAYNYSRKMDKIVKILSTSLKTSPENLVKHIEQLPKEYRSMESQTSNMQIKLAVSNFTICKN